MKKLLPLIIMSSNLLYSNVLSININFGNESNVRTYNNGFPNKYLDIDLKETRSLYSVADFDFTHNLTTNSIGDFNIPNNTTYTNWNEFKSWGNQYPANLSSDNVVILNKKISELTPPPPPLYSFFSFFFQTQSLSFEKANSFNSQFQNYDYCSRSRYESFDFYVNILKSENDSDLNQNIKAFTPELIIKNKIMNNVEGIEFQKDYLNILEFINFFSGDFSSNYIKNNFSKIIFSVDLNKWEYRNNITKNSSETNLLNTKIDKAIYNLSEIKNTTNQRDYLIDVLNIVKNLNGNYQSSLSTSNNLFNGYQVCLNNSSEINSVLNSLNSISVSNKTYLLNYMNKYNTEKIIFNYKKELLKFKPNTFQPENFTLNKVPNPFASGGAGNTSTEMKVVYEWIDKRNLNFEKYGALVSKILTTEGSLISVTNNTYFIPSSYNSQINLNQNNDWGKSNGEILAEETALYEEVQNTVNQENEEELNQETASSLNSISLSSDIINLKFGTNLGTVVEGINNTDAEDYTEEWEWLERLNVHIVDSENEIRESNRNSLNSNINNNIDLINSKQNEIENIEGQISNEESQDTIAQLEGEKLILQNDQGDLLQENEGFESDLLLNQDLTDEEEATTIENRIYDEYSSFE